MRERPEGPALLQLAATALREQILPILPDDMKYVGLMILKAVSIAERQLRIDERPLRSERSFLEALLKESHQHADLPTYIAELERELARRVRVGAYDEDGAGQRALRDITLQRVRESAPRSLDSEGSQ